MLSPSLGLGVTLTPTWDNAEGVTGWQRVCTITDNSALQQACDHAHGGEVARGGWRGDAIAAAVACRQAAMIERAKVVIGIIAILSAIGIPAYQNYLRKAALTDLLQTFVCSRSVRAALRR
jgi:hypothetical protein